MKQWCIEAGGNVTMDFIEKGIKEKVTPLDNLYYVALKNATDELLAEKSSIQTFYSFFLN